MNIGFFLLLFVLPLIIVSMIITNTGYIPNKNIKNLSSKTKPADRVKLVGDVYLNFRYEINKMMAGKWVPRKARIETTRTLELLSNVWKAYKKGYVNA